MSQVARRVYPRRNFRRGRERAQNRDESAAPTPKRTGDVKEDINLPIPWQGRSLSSYPVPLPVYEAAGMWSDIKNYTRALLKHWCKFSPSNVACLLTTPAPHQPEQSV